MSVLSPLAADLIVTVLNEEEAIIHLLESVEKLEPYPARVIVIDAGSDDETVQRARAWKAPDGLEVEVIESPGANISAGRNTGIKNARFDYVLVTDAGTKLAPTWAKDLCAALDDGADVASGFFTPDHSALFQSALGIIITPHLREVDPATFLPSSRSVAFRREPLLETGGYPEWLDYCEDLVLDLELKRENRRFVFVPDALVSWNSRPSLKAYFKQYYRYARGDGKADLWAKRHIARYSAYAAGAVLVVSSTPISLSLLGIGLAIYFYRPLSRIWRFKEAPQSHRLAALVLMPFVVITGDIAKMLGYPVGRRWRRLRRATRERTLD